MGLFEQLGYTNFHAVNLKWILDRMVDFETRLTTAEGKISSLEDRMDTAESDIDALEGRMDTAEDDIDALEGRMDTAEGNIQDNADDILGLQTQMPSSIAADAGRVLTATGAGAASWQDVPKELPVYSALASPNTLGIKSDGTLGWLHFSAIVPDKTGNAGKVLAVNSYENGVEWISNDVVKTLTWIAGGSAPDVDIEEVATDVYNGVRYYLEVVNQTSHSIYRMTLFYAHYDTNFHEGVIEFLDPKAQASVEAGLIAAGQVDGSKEQYMISATKSGGTTTWMTGALT